MRGRPNGTPGNTLSQTEPMSTKLDDAFATLRILIADTSRDLALAMAELRSVAAERDKLKIERDSANWSLSRAKESLRAAEADLAETEDVNSALRRALARVKEMHAAAMESVKNATRAINHFLGAE